MFCIMLRPWEFTFALTSAIVATLSVNEIRKEGLYFLLRSLLHKIELRGCLYGVSQPGYPNYNLGQNPFSGAVAGGGQGVCPHPIVETRRKIVNVVGNCQSCRRWGGGDLKCCRPEKFLVCRKIFWFVGKSFRFVGKILPLPPPQTPPPQKKTWDPQRH